MSGMMSPSNMFEQKIPVANNDLDSVLDKISGSTTMQGALQRVTAT